MKINLTFPIKIYKVMSRSEPGLYHTVMLYNDGSLVCNCIAGTYRRGCYHRDKVQKYIDKKGQPTQNNIKK